MKSPARLVVGAKDFGQSPGKAPFTSERGRRGGWVGGGGMEGHFGSGPQLKKGSQSNEGPYNFLIQDCLTENINLGCVKRLKRRVIFVKSEKYTKNWGN